MKPKPPAPLSDYRKLSDEEVIRRYVQRHEPHAIHCLYDRYSHLVLGVCIKYLSNVEAAKDATQQIFIQLLEDLIKYRVEHFKPWLMQVVRNYCLMQLRRNTIVTDNSISLSDELDWEAAAPPDMEREQLIQQLEAAVATLSKDQRICIELFYLQRLTYALVSARTGYTIGEVKSHIQNGKRNLKIKLSTVRPVQP